MKVRSLLLILFILLSKTLSAQYFEWAEYKTGNYSREYVGQSFDVDNNKNLIVGGRALGCPVCYSAFITKYDSANNVVFNFDLSTIDGNVCKVASVDVDLSNNIYFVLTANGPLVRMGSDTINMNTQTWTESTCIVKLNPSGNLLWNVVVPASALSIGPNGNVYVINGTDLRVYTSSTGALLWSTTITASDWIEANNNHLIVGDSSNIRRISPVSGSLLSTIPVSGLQSIALDDNGDIYTGTTTGIAKYGAANQLMWSISPGHINSIGISPQYIWVSQKEQGPDFRSPIGKFHKGTGLPPSGTFSFPDTLVNTPAAVVKPIRDGAAYVHGVVGTSINTTNEFVKWDPYILFGDYNRNYVGYVLGKYSSASGSGNIPEACGVQRHSA